MGGIGWLQEGWGFSLWLMTPSPHIHVHTIFCQCLQ
jgi:hypothetical protein